MIAAIKHREWLNKYDYNHFLWHWTDICWQQNATKTLKQISQPLAVSLSGCKNIKDVDCIVATEEEKRRKTTTAKRDLFKLIRKTQCRIT